MRVTYRKDDISTYWMQRWAAIPIDDSMQNEEVYPLKYALHAIDYIAMNKKSRILEAGCGAGRILRWFHARGYNITGIDFIGEVVNKIKTAFPDISVEKGNILNLQFSDAAFNVIFAFGLYHSLPYSQLNLALNETYRVLSPTGVLLLSYRADNICNLINDILKDNKNTNAKCFHKTNLTEQELKNSLEQAGFEVINFDYVINMPIFYKFKCFRHKTHKTFNEHLARKEGYRLNILGKFLQRLSSLFPSHTCNIYVAMCRKS